MKEFIEKLNARLEELNQSQIEKCTEYSCDGNLNCIYDRADLEGAKVKTTYDIIQFVNKLAEEYKETISKKENVVWILCSVKLPKTGTQRDVWICFDKESVSYKARWCLDHFEWDNGRVIKEDILAWMPNDVPQPYKEGE